MCQRKFVDSLLSVWVHSNAISPAGKIGCIKVFDGLKIPMNLFPALPVFQLQFCQTATLALLNVSKLFGTIGKYLLLMTENTHDSRAVYEARNVVS